MSRLEQSLDQVRSDEPGSAGDENVHICTVTRPPIPVERTKRTRERRQNRSEYRCYLPVLAGFSRLLSIVPGAGMIRDPARDANNFTVSVLAVYRAMLTTRGSLPAACKMPTLLLYASAALLLASAGLGYMNFSRLKERTTQLKERSEKLTKTTSDLGSTKKELKGMQEQFTTSAAKVTALESNLAQAKTESERVNSQITDLQLQIAAKQTEVEQLKAQVATAKPGGEPGAPDESQRRLVELQAQVAELSQVKTSLDDKLAATESRVRGLQLAEQRRQVGVAARGLSGEVLAVNQSWNFVVLNLGDRQGVTPNAEMLVMRRGAMVGKVRITSVEPSQSIADIVPSSLAPGLVVQPGDRVIYPGS